MSAIWKTGSKESDFLQSALTRENAFQSLDSFRQWFQDRNNAGEFSVEIIPLDKLQKWSADPKTGDYIHDSGKFFQIHGLKVETNFGGEQSWEQPIINQPEIGILGIITKKFDGVRYFLMQAKMEPGNVNVLQLSPTVQATKSNYTQAHEGKLPNYLEYFLEKGRGHVLYDQLQSEQGARFFKKRNRNIIIEVEEEIPVLDDFRWLTLWEIKELLKEDDIVNMDSRTVVSCIPLIDTVMKSNALQAGPSELGQLRPFGRDLSDYAQALFVSGLVDDRHTEEDADSLISWITELKTIFELKTEYVPLNELKDWKVTDGKVAHSSGNFFSVIGVSVKAGSREVVGWTQPLLAQEDIGIVSFITQLRNGVLHFLVQAKVEAGNFDTLELTPTVSCAEPKKRLSLGDTPPFLELVMNASPKQVRHKSIQSEEGGRFYHFRNEYRIIELSESTQLELPINYKWMSLRQIMELMRYNNYFNIEARGLLSCLSFE